MDPVDGGTRTFVLLKAVGPEDKHSPENYRVTWPLKDFKWDGEKPLDKLDPDQIGYYPDPRTHGVSFLISLLFWIEVMISWSVQADRKICSILCKSFL